ncbi:MAG TPA: tyrosine-type recombinase/integrase [Aggregatilineaceae bacterium]|nr:tyrosine-type recombinase/integrase [Aggregatilineaceae bacterium]
MSKRYSGEGTISKRRDGRWQASLQVNGIRRTVYGKTEREARTKLRDLQREADKAGSLPDPGKRTVKDLFETWLTTAPNLKTSTRVKYRWFLETYANPAIGNLRLNRVAPDRLQSLYASLSPSTAEKLHRILHRAFEVAQLWGWITTNPCDRVLKPTYKARRKTLLNQTELNQFLDGTENHWLHPLWVLLIGTGCRIGEMLALKWEDVGQYELMICVSHTLHRINGDWVLDTVKTENSVRNIVLPIRATTALQQQKQQQETWKEAAGSKWVDWGLVFTGETGSPLFASTVQHALKRECERLKLPLITPHSLRHMHASFLLNEGVPITAVSARLGHATPQITMKIYAHALPGQDRLAAEAISKTMSGNEKTEEI